MIFHAFGELCVSLFVTWLSDLFSHLFFMKSSNIGDLTFKKSALHFTLPTFD